MKILRNIIVGIGVLAALLCALIILSAANPGITQTLSSLLSGDGLPSKEEESGETIEVEEPEFSDQLSDPSSEAGEEEEEPEEAGEALGISRDNVYVRIFRGKQKIRSKFGERKRA